MFSDVFRGYRKATPGCNRLMVIIERKGSVRYIRKGAFFEIISLKNTLK